MAYGMAGITEPRKQIHIAEPYDPFDYKELHHLEGLLLFDKGKAPEAAAAGVTARDGDLPCCPSGGLLGVGNPIAAAGLMKIAELFWQLRGEAGARQVPGTPERGVAFQELAARAVAALGHPVVGEMTTTAEEPEVTAYCAQVAEVEVDPDTGQVTVHQIVTAHDVGTIINPLDHQGQIDGAVMQGLGYALMEGLHADEGRISTLSLGEAKIPTMQDIPTLITVLVEAPGGEGPFQGKAIGENPISPVAPAIANAVHDAVGVRIQDLPITAEKVHFASHP